MKRPESAEGGDRSQRSSEKFISLASGFLSFYSERMLKTVNISWDAIAAKVRQITGEEDYNRWMRNAHVLKCAPRGIEIAVPNLFMKNWFEANFREKIAAAAAEVTDIDVPVVFSVDHRVGAPPTKRTEKENPAGGIKQPPAAPVSHPSAHLHSCSLNANFTFEHFQASQNNRMAVSAAKDVAASPGKTFNPLYLYGPPGVGKTHLLQAVAAEMKDRHNARVMYVSGEQFFSEYRRAITTDGMKKFRDKFLGCRALIVDDIHKIATKTQTQNEFHLLFDRLIDHGQQIVISGRMFPREIKGLKEELMQRFLCGLVIKMDVPDVPGRARIVESVIARARCRGALVGRDVINFIAENFSRSVRSLIGATHRILAYQHLLRRDATPEPMTVSQARVALGELLANESHSIDAADVLDSVARYFQITPESIVRNTKKMNIVLPRQIAMFLSRKLTDMSLAEIGRYFGGRNHSTVTNAEKKISACKQNGEPVITRALAAIEEDLFR